MASGFSDAEVAAECDRVERDFGLPACDVIRHGPGKLVEAVLELKESAPMKLTLHRFDLHTRHAFTTFPRHARGQAAVVVELEQDGIRGYGEAPESSYYGADAAGAEAALERRGGESKRPGSTIRPNFGSNSSRCWRDTPFAQCALDVAAHDLWGKLRGAPLWKLWGLAVDRVPPSDYTIGIDTVEVMRAKLAEMPGFPVYKIKLGVSADLDVLAALRRNSEATFRVDVNGGWTAEETIARAGALAALNVELIEQPLPAEQDEQMAQVLPVRRCRYWPTKVAAARPTWIAAWAASMESTSSWPSAAD